MSVTLKRESGFQSKVEQNIIPIFEQSGNPLLQEAACYILGLKDEIRDLENQLRRAENEAIKWEFEASEYKADAYSAWEAYDEVMEELKYLRKEYA